MKRPETLMRSGLSISAADVVVTYEGERGVKETSHGGKGLLKEKAISPRPPRAPPLLSGFLHVFGKRICCRLRDARALAAGMVTTLALALWLWFH